MSANFGELKRGGTLAFYAALKDESGNPITGSTAYLTSQIRTRSDKLIDTFTITETDTPGTYLFKAGDTSAYPLGELDMDIKFSNGSVSFSGDYTMTIVRPQTHE